MPSPSPEPGSLAALAAADQRAAAQRDTLAWAAALLHDGEAQLLPAAGPWAARMLRSAAHPYVRRCTHLARARGPMPMAVPAYGHTVCADCFDDTVADLDWHNPRCRHCSTPRPGLLSHRPHIAQHSHIVVHGRLCFACVDAEHSAMREAR